MALLNRLSIKWKLSFALILTGLALVLSYAVMTNRVFREDKIGYVYDAQASRLDSLKREIEGRLEKDLLTGRSVVATFNQNEGRISASGEAIFKESPSLLALELWNETKNQTIIRLEKAEHSLPTGSQKPDDSQATSVVPVSDKELLLSYRWGFSDNETLILRLLVDLKSLLPPPTPAQSLVLADQGHVLAISDLRGRSSEQLEIMLEEFPDLAVEKTLLYEKGEFRDIVSTKPLSFGKLRVFSITAEEEALGALNTLVQRSVLFLLVAIFALILVSLTLARGLTSNLGVLTDAAEEIGKGHFEAAPQIASHDEIGILSQAFQRMVKEIQDLLVKTREGARMEEELKTARLVQERLMPAHAKASMGEIELYGEIKTASETGGDWWYYFPRGDELIIAIADATGHGTPAALITSAARSVFSTFENKDLSLLEMMQLWDNAIESCGQRQVLMTAILLRINCRTGQGVLMSAAHETPYKLIANKEQTFGIEALDIEIAHRLGEREAHQLTEFYFQLDPNDSLVLYTDGLYSVMKGNEQVMSEKRFTKALAQKAEFCQDSVELTRAVFQIFDDYRVGLPLPDDVAVISIKRSGSVLKAHLADEIGQIKKL